MNERDGGVKGARPRHHGGRGGSIPAPSLFFHTHQRAEVLALVRRYHYSRRAPSSVQFVGSLHEAGGLFGQMGEPVAGACFSTPACRGWPEAVLELSRLVRRDDCPGVPLTLLIRLCLSKLRRNGTDLIVSYADVKEGHLGTVYQAASWSYAGMREPDIDGVLIDGRFVPGRTANEVWGTRSWKKLAERLPHSTVELSRDRGKHLYWRALTRAGAAKAARLKLETLPYPKG